MLEENPGEDGCTRLVTDGLYTCNTLLGRWDDSDHKRWDFFLLRWWQSLELLDSVRWMQCSGTRSLNTLLHPRPIVAKRVRAKESRVTADS